MMQADFCIEQKQLTKGIEARIYIFLQKRNNTKVKDFHHLLLFNMENRSAQLRSRLLCTYILLKNHKNNVVTVAFF